MNVDLLIGAGRRSVLCVAALLTLAGCGGSTEDKIGRLMVAPDKFYLYTCEQYESQGRSVLQRQKQLEQLMAKAETTADGRIVSALAYQSQYTETVADMNELRRASAAKDCKPGPALARPADKPAS